MQCDISKHLILFSVANNRVRYSLAGQLIGSLGVRVQTGRVQKETVLKGRIQVGKVPVGRMRESNHQIPVHL